MSTLNVDPAQMDADADGFSRVSDVAEEIGSYVRNGLGNLGNFWGGDKTGSEFIEAWNPGVLGLLGTFSGVGDGMRATADSVTTSAGLYRRSNEVNTELAG